MYNATFKIIIFGEATLGREMFMQKSLTNLFVSDQKMTVGVDFEVKSLSINGLKIKLSIWDFSGEVRFRLILPTYVRQARGGLFLYDITNYSSFRHLDDWLSIIRKELKPEDIFPIIVVGIVPDEEGERQVSSEEGIKIAKSRNVNGFIECNPKTGENVEKTFEALTRLMLDDTGYQRSEKKGAKERRKMEEVKDEEYLITYTASLEKKLRKLETKNQIIRYQIKQLKKEKQSRLNHDLNDLQNKIGKYKKMGR